jgi:hypothetical protein
MRATVNLHRRCVPSCSQFARRVLLLDQQEGGGMTMASGSRRCRLRKGEKGGGKGRNGRKGSGVVL